MKRVRTYARILTAASRTLSVGTLALYMIFVAAGFPMMTFLCGSGDLILACTMGDCSAPPVTTLSFTPPPCCIGVEQRSDLTDGVVASPKVEQAHLVTTVVDQIHTRLTAGGQSVQTHVAGASPPLHLLTHTLLI